MAIAPHTLRPSPRPPSAQTTGAPNPHTSASNTRHRPHTLDSPRSPQCRLPQPSHSCAKTLFTPSLTPRHHDPRHARHQNIPAHTPYRTRPDICSPTSSLTSSRHHTHARNAHARTRKPERLRRLAARPQTGRRTYHCSRAAYRTRPYAPPSRPHPTLAAPAPARYPPLHGLGPRKAYAAASTPRAARAPTTSSRLPSPPPGSAPPRTRLYASAHPPPPLPPPAPPSRHPPPPPPPPLSTHPTALRTQHPHNAHPPTPDSRPGPNAAADPSRPPPIRHTHPAPHDTPPNIVIQPSATTPHSTPSKPARTRLENRT
jgi:hypothetical protein